jgi:hypothetical protein
MSSLAAEHRQPRARSVAVNEESLTVDLVDGRTIIVPLAWYPRLWHGTPEERSRFEIFGDGTYIHWPDLDEDLTVAGLLEGLPSSAEEVVRGAWATNSKISVTCPVLAKRFRPIAEKRDG